MVEFTVVWDPLHTNAFYFALCKAMPSLPRLLSLAQTFVKVQNASVMHWAKVYDFWMASIIVQRQITRLCGYTSFKEYAELECQ